MFDPKRNGKSWYKQHNEYLSEFLLTHDEQTYIEQHKADGQAYWFEIIELQKNMRKYEGILSQVSLSMRRRLLINVAGTNFSRSKLMREYGLTKPKVLAFIKNENRHNSFGVEVMSSLAILCRVPLTWLENDIVDHYWGCDHFRSVNRNIWTWTDVEKYLNQKDSHTIRGVVVHDEHGDHYLRIEKANETIIVEVFNTTFDGLVIQKCINLFSVQKYKIGLAQTVIPSKVNVVFCVGVDEEPYPYIKFI